MPPHTMVTASFVLVLSLLTGHAQTAPAPAPPSPANFAQEPFVIKRFSVITAMNADGTGTRTQTSSIQIQSEAALRTFGVISVPFSSQSESAEFLILRVHHPDGTIQDTAVNDAIEQPAPVTREAPFYSDIKTRDLPVKSLRVGDTLEWQSRVTRKHPEFTGQFWGQDTLLTGAVILDEQHELRLPATLPILVWTNERDSTAPAESTEGSEHVYRWHHSDLHPTVGPSAAAAKHAEEIRVRTPDEATDALRGKLPSLAWTTFPSWVAVGDWYRSLSADRAVPDATVTAKATELTAGKTSDLEKAQTLYTYVSTQIRYIGVAFGIGRYRPHTAAEVLANQYGDCKDKHILLAAMLTAVGLHAEPVLIGENIRFNPAVPSPVSFNHLITAVHLGGETLLLDTTPEVAPWRALTFPLRNQQALEIPATGPAALITTPLDLPYPANISTLVTSTLTPSLSSESHFVITFRDDSELFLRSAFRNTSPSEYGTLVQNIMRAMGFGGTTSDPVVDHLDDTSKPLVLSFQYHRDHDESWGENRVTIPFLYPSLPALDAKAPTVLPVRLDAPHTEVTTVELTLPKDWTSAGKLIAERRVSVLKNETATKDAGRYQHWFDEAGVSSVPFLQLSPPAKQ